MNCWIWESGCRGDDYAAWIQAIGSILALAIVIAIERHHNTREINKLREDSSSRHRSQLKSVLFLIGAMRELLENHFPNESDKATYDKVALTEATGDLLNEIRSHASDELEDEERMSYFAVRRNFSEIFSHTHFGDESVFARHHIERLLAFEAEFKGRIESLDQRTAR